MKKLLLSILFALSFAFGIAQTQADVTYVEGLAFKNYTTTQLNGIVKKIEGDTYYDVTKGNLVYWKGGQWNNVGNGISPADQIKLNYITITSPVNLNDLEPRFTKNTAFNKNFGTVSGSVLEGNWRPDWGDVSDKPTTFPPSAHTHTFASITGNAMDNTSLATAFNSKQNLLVSGSNIKTVNGNSLLGPGNVAIETISSFADIEGSPFDNTNLASALDAKANDNEVVKTDINSELQNLKLAVGDSATIANNPSPNTIWINTESHAPGGDNYLTGGSLSGAGVLSLNMNYGSPIQIPGFNSGGGGGTVSWGGIGGTIGDQTDLIGLFNGKENTFSKNTGFNKNFGTTTGTVLQGNWRPTWEDVTGKPTTFMLKSENLSGLANYTTARSNLGLGTIAILNAIASSNITDGTIVNADINASAAIDATKIANGSVTNTEFQYINSLTSNAQAQLNNKPDISDVWLNSASASVSPTGAITARSIYLGGTEGDLKSWFFQKDAGNNDFYLWLAGGDTAYIFDKDGIPHTNSSVITKGYADANYGGSGTGVGDMLKSVYDTNNNNIVDNSTQLNGQSAAYYLAFGNATGTISNSQIANSAVTQSKLSVTGTATSGKILSTNGSTLQWSDSQTSGSYSVDVAYSGAAFTAGSTTATLHWVKTGKLVTFNIPLGTFEVKAVTPDTSLRGIIAISGFSDAALYRTAIDIALSEYSFLNITDGKMSFIESDEAIVNLYFYNFASSITSSYNTSGNISGSYITN